MIEFAGELKTARALDRERVSEYLLLAHVQDKDHTQWECVSLIDIALSDLNDNAPAFPAANFTTSISEDATIGTLITKMHASDDDIGRFFIISAPLLFFIHSLNLLHENCVTYYKTNTN